MYAGFARQRVRTTITPSLIRPETFGKRAVGREPAADEAAARLLRPRRVDRAAALAAEMARLAGLHFVAANRAHHPAVAARRAGARAPRGGLNRDHRAVTLLVFLPLPQGTWIVPRRLHFPGEYTLVPSLRIASCIGERWRFTLVAAVAAQFDQPARQQGLGLALRARARRRIARGRRARGAVRRLSAAARGARRARLRPLR